MRRHDRKWKETEAAEITKLLDSHTVIGIIDLKNFPANLFQTLRKKLQGKAVFKVSKTNVIKKGFENSKMKGNEIEKFVKESCALIFTELNPFEFYSFIKRNKGKAFAKPGSIAPDDIIIPAGDTGLPPGPALSELKAAGLNIRPMGQTIHIMEDKVVTKKGEAVTKPVAAVLSKLDIKPIKVQMNVVAAFDGTILYQASVLDIDTDAVFNDFKQAHFNAFNLALNVSYLTTQTLPLLFGKAHRDAMAVALKADFLTKETAGIILAKAVAQAEALQALVKELPAEQATETKADDKSETQKEGT